MSDNKNKFSVIDINSDRLIDVLEEPTLNILNPVSKALAEIVLGALANPVHRSRIKRVALKKELEKFINSYENEIKTIPNENLSVPKPYVAIPIIECISYVYDNESIHNMFVKLLAKASNIETNELVHPSYIELIKNLSPMDAEVLNYIFKEEDNFAPICDIRDDKNILANSTRLQFNQIFLELMDESNFEKFEPEVFERVFQYSSSIDNLTRLGLLKFPQNASFEDVNSYKKYEDYAKVCFERLKLENFQLSLEIGEFMLEKQCVTLTHFGKNFAIVVLQS